MLADNELNLMQAATMSPEVFEKQQELNRKQQLARMLMQQNQQPTGQMVSGRYVPTSFFQNIAPVANMLTGAYLQNKGDEQAKALASELRGTRVAEMDAINQAIANKDWNKAQQLINTSTTGAGKEMLPRLMQNVIPQQLTEKDKEELRLKELDIKSRAAQHAQSMAQSRVPMGYRMTTGGALEAIPGGPADLKMQAKAAGADAVDLAVSTLRDKYNKLNDLNAIQNTEKSWLENLEAGASSSDWGQAISNKLGTQAASARNSIAMERPKLLAAIQKATGMSAKQIDSNAELKLWLSAATDPKKDFASNMEALDNIERSLGSLSIQTTGALPSESSIDAEIARRKKNK